VRNVAETALSVQRLINDRGRVGMIADWLDQITADCPKKSSRAPQHAAVRENQRAI